MENETVLGNIQKAEKIAIEKNAQKGEIKTFLTTEQKGSLTRELVDLENNLNAKTDIPKQMALPIIRLDIYTNIFDLPEFVKTSQQTKEDRISINRKGRKEIVKVSTQEVEDENKDSQQGIWKSIFGFGK